MVRDQRTHDRERLIDGAGNPSDDAATTGQGEFPRLPSYNEIANTYPAQTNYIGDVHSQGIHDPGENDNAYDTAGAQGSRYGLIRGYHRQMYEPVASSRQCCDCSSIPAPKDEQSPEYNWGVISGCLLLILGVLALVMGFLLPRKSSSSREELTPEEAKDLEKNNFFVDTFIISGLSVLSIGGLAISLGLLLPLFRRNRVPLDESFKFYDSEVYVKQEDSLTKSGNLAGTVNFGFHKDIVPTDITLRKVQPEYDRRQPIDLKSDLRTNR